MKIEIELSEVEHLKARIEKQQEQINTLESKLKELDEKELKSKAVALSKWLFENYIRCVFKGLGFKAAWNGWGRQYTEINTNLERNLGKSWWNEEDKINIEISASVTEEFKSAFLRIGIIAGQVKTEDTLEWVTENKN